MNHCLRSVLQSECRFRDSIGCQEEEEVEKHEVFWEEFFLHKPDPASLKAILADLSADDLLHFQVCAKGYSSYQNLTLCLCASPTICLTIHQSNKRRSFAFGRECTRGMVIWDYQKQLLTNKTLTIFLGSVLSKKYTNPSSDIITVLARLHDADIVFSD